MRPKIDGRLLAVGGVVLLAVIGAAIVVAMEWFTGRLEGLMSRRKGEIYGAHAADPRPNTPRNQREKRK